MSLDVLLRKTVSCFFPAVCFVAPFHGSFIVWPLVGLPTGLCAWKFAFGHIRQRVVRSGVGILLFHSVSHDAKKNAGLL